MKALSSVRKLFRYRGDLGHSVESARQTTDRGWPVWTDLDMWIDLKAQNTRKKYRAYLREYCDLMSIQFDTDGFSRLVSATPVEANRYISWCKSRPAQPGRSAAAGDNVALSTVQNKSAVLYSIFEELKNQGHVTENPFTKQKKELRRVRGNDRRPHQLIPFEKVEALWELDWKGSKEATTKAILAALFGGGLRSSEALALRVMDVRQTSKGTWYLNLRNTKRQKQEIQTLADFAGPIIVAHVERRRKEGASDKDPLFTDYADNGPTNEPIYDRTLRRRFTRALTRVGLHGDYSPHCARATAITALLEEGVSHRMVAKFSRHSSVEMVSHYDKMRNVEGEDVAAKLTYGRKKGLGNG